MLKVNVKEEEEEEQQTDSISRCYEKGISSSNLPGEQRAHLSNVPLFLLTIISTTALKGDGMEEEEEEDLLLQQT